MDQAGRDFCSYDDAYSMNFKHIINLFLLQIKWKSNLN